MFYGNLHDSNSWSNWTLYGVISRSPQLCLRNVQLLRTTVNWYWWRFTHTFCHSSNILGCTHCYWLFPLSFKDEDASFFHFFHKNRRKKRMTVLIFFQNPYSVFAHMLQHYHDFQSNIAILLSVVQAYTQPYSFAGRIKLIICQIRQELSVTIREISTNWKKNLRWLTQ